MTSFGCRTTEVGARVGVEHDQVGGRPSGQPIGAEQSGPPGRGPSAKSAPDPAEGFDLIGQDAVGITVLGSVPAKTGT